MYLQVHQIVRARPSMADEGVEVLLSAQLSQQLRQRRGRAPFPSLRRHPASRPFVRDYNGHREAISTSDRAAV